jgi:hypothetical protein
MGSATTKYLLKLREAARDHPRVRRPTSLCCPPANSRHLPSVNTSNARLHLSKFQLAFGNRRRSSASFPLSCPPPSGMRNYPYNADFIKSVPARTVRYPSHEQIFPRNPQRIILEQARRPRSKGVNVAEGAATQRAPPMKTKDEGGSFLEYRRIWSGHLT